jgi:hypothetical protein
MPPSTKPFRLGALTWPVTARQWQALSDMVEDIYQRLKEGVENTSGLIFTVLTTGFSISGGNPLSKTLTVVGDASVSGTTSGTNTGDQTITLTGDVTGTGTGSFVATIAAGVIVDADINASAAIAWSKLSKTGSSLADLTTRSATDLTSGTLPDARFPATLPAASGVNLTALNASNLGSGTVPDARFPATLPAASGVNLTALNATNIASGTLADARLSSKVPLDDVAETISGVWNFSNGLKERGRAFKMGEWTAVAYTAGDFTGSGSMVWTVEAGDVLGFSYTIVSGATMIVSLRLSSTTTSGTASNVLNILIPGGFTAAQSVNNPTAVLADAGVATTGRLFVTSGATTIGVARSDAANFTLGTNATQVYAEIAFPIQV